MRSAREISLLAVLGFASLVHAADQPVFGNSDA